MRVSWLDSRDYSRLQLTTMLLMSKPRSVRFEDDVLARLERYVRAHPGTSASAITNLFVDEALRMAEHPGVVFRDGPTGRRAGLANGPDIWEIIGTLRMVQREEPDLVGTDLLAAVEEASGLDAVRIRTAIRYYTDYPTDVDERIAANEEAADQAEQSWLAEQELLGGGGRADT